MIAISPSFFALLCVQGRVKGEMVIAKVQSSA